jgi:hypothetical protein
MLIIIVIDRWFLDVDISLGRQGKEEGDRLGGTTAADLL